MELNISQIEKTISFLTSGSCDSDRFEVAFKLNEKLKLSPDAFPVGLQLIESQDTACQLFALQLLTSFIKTHWSKINSVNEKNVLRNKMLVVLQKKCALDDVAFPYSIRTGFAKTLAEMLKLDYPQHWDSCFTQDLISNETETPQITKLSDLHFCEITVNTVLYLIQDCCELNLVIGQRKNDILKALTFQLPILSKFIHTHLVSLSQLINLSRITDLTSNVVSTLSGFLDCVSMLSENFSSFLINSLSNCSFVNALFDLLEDRKFAGKSLLALVSLLCTTEETFNKKLLKEGNASDVTCLKDAISRYFFTANHLQFLASLAGEISSYTLGYGYDEESYFISTGFVDFHTKILRHIIKSKFYDEINQEHLQQLLGNLFNVVHSDGTSFSSKDLIFDLFIYTSSEQKFVSLAVVTDILIQLQNNSKKMLSFLNGKKIVNTDFDTTETFTVIWNQYLKMLISISSIDFHFYSHFEQIALSQIDTIISSVAEPDKSSNVEWMIIGKMLSVVAASYLKLKSRCDNGFPTKLSATVNKLLLIDFSDFKSDVSIPSHLLEYISDLVPVVDFNLQMLTTLLLKLFEMITAEYSDSDTRAVKNLRVHGCGIVKKISTYHGKSLLPVFDKYLEFVTSLAETDKLNLPEKTVLAESLLNVANNFADDGKQNQIVLNLLTPCLTLVSGDQDLRSAIENTDSMIAYIGLSKGLDLTNEVYFQRRTQISYLVNMNLTIMKACTRSQDEENPSVGIEQTLQLFPFVCEVFVRFLELRNPCIYENFSNCMKDLFVLNKKEKLFIMGLDVVSFDNSVKIDEEKNMMEKFRVVYDITVGNLFQYFSILPKYLTPGQVLFSKRDTVLPWYLRILDSILKTTQFHRTQLCNSFISMIRNIWTKNLISHEFQNLWIPLLTQLFQNMYDFLSSDWLRVDTSQTDFPTSLDHAGDEEINNEVVYDCLIQRITIDYAGLLGDLLLSTSNPNSINYTKREKNSDKQDDSEMKPIQTSDGGNKQDYAKQRLQFYNNKLSNTGIELLNDSRTLELLTMTVFHGISFPNSGTALRLFPIGMSIVSYLVTNGAMTQDAAIFIFRRTFDSLGRVPNSLEIFSPMTLDVFIILGSTYESEFCELLQQVPSFSMETFNLLKNQITRGKIFKAKNTWKNMITSLCNVHVSRLGLSEKSQCNLPRFILPKKEKIEEVANLSNFFSPDD